MKLVLPGEDMGNEEELFPASGSYLENGYLKSKYVGRCEISAKSVHVIPFKRIFIPKKSTKVLAQIYDISEPVALAKFQINARHSADSGDFAFLHITNISNRFLKTIREAVKPRDIIYASIINVGKNIEISIKGRDEGVILAYCGDCKRPLIREDYILKCNVCDTTETRKLSPFYDNYRGVIKWLNH